MISKTLIKLIDQAIVPAILLLTVRLSSIVLISYYKGLTFTFDSSGFVFPTQDDYIFVNSYSALTMLVVLAVGLVYILIKAFLFHESHITPHLTIKLFQMRLVSFIQNSFELYSQGVIWLSYLFLLVGAIGVLAFTGLVYKWVFYSGLILGLISTAILVIDVENEIELKKRGSNKFIEDDTPTHVYLKKTSYYR